MFFTDQGDYSEPNVKNPHMSWVAWLGLAGVLVFS